MRLRYLSVTVPLLAAAVALTGCSAMPFEDLDLGAPAAAETTPAPTPEVEYAVGDVPNNAALELRPDFKQNLSAYELTDGTWVQIDKTAPLPDAVKLGLGVRAAALPDTPSAATDTNGDATVRSVYADNAKLDSALGDRRRRAVGR